MVKINEIAKGTGLSKAWLYEKGINNLKETEQIQRLVQIAQDMKSNADLQAARAARVRGYALVWAIERDYQASRLE